MSGQDERAKQFKESAEAKLCGDQLTKEITTLRRFLFRNQEYRFTKAAQGNLYMAILAHHANPASLDAGRAGEPPILKLLDDALKMPFTVFTSSQKDKLLQLYWSVLGQEGNGTNAAGPSASAHRMRELTLLDVTDEGKNAGLLSLMHDDGREYSGRVVVSDAEVCAKLRDALDSGASVAVTISESADGVEATLDGYTVEDGYMAH